MAECKRWTGYCCALHRQQTDLLAESYARVALKTGCFYKVHHTMDRCPDCCYLERGLVPCLEECFDIIIQHIDLTEVLKDLPDCFVDKECIDRLYRKKPPLQPNEPKIDYRFLRLRSLDFMIKFMSS